MFGWFTSERDPTPACSRQDLAKAMTKTSRQRYAPAAGPWPVRLGRVAIIALALGLGFIGCRGVFT